MFFPETRHSTTVHTMSTSKENKRQAYNWRQTEIIRGGFKIES